MRYSDIVFMPLSDTGANELEVIKKHNNLIDNKQLSDAADLANTTNKGFKASLFTFIQKRIEALELYILNEFVADEGEYYSYNEPNIEEMPENATFFIQIINKAI